MTTTTIVAIPLFPQFTALDGIGPYEVLQRIPDFDVTFIGHERGVVRSDAARGGGIHNTGSLTMTQSTVSENSASGATEVQAIWMPPKPSFSSVSFSAAALRSRSSSSLRATTGSSFV